MALSKQYDWTDTSSNTIKPEELKAEIDPTETVDRIDIDASAETFTVILANDLSDWSAVDAIVAAHDGSAADPFVITVAQKAEKAMELARAMSRIMARKTDGFIDDFANGDGIDDSESSNYTIDSEGYIKSTNGGAATIITARVSSWYNRNKVIFNRQALSGSPSFFISSDDGDTWEEVTSFDEEVSVTSGKKFRAKVTLSGSDRVSLLAFEAKN